MNKVKAFQNLGSGMVSLPKDVGLASDKQFMIDGYAKV